MITWIKYNVILIVIHDLVYLLMSFTEQHRNHNSRVTGPNKNPSVIYESMMDKIFFALVAPSNSNVFNSRSITAKKTQHSKRNKQQQHNYHVRPSLSR